MEPTELKEISDQLTRIEDAISRSEAMIEKVVAEVAPTIQALMESPMLKMLLPKGSKK